MQAAEGLVVLTVAGGAVISKLQGSMVAGALDCLSLYIGLACVGRTRQLPQRV